MLATLERWRRKYLHNLSVRSGWQDNPSNIKVGDLVFLLEDQTPLHLPTGRVLRMHPRSGSVVRFVTVCKSYIQEIC